MKCAKSVFVVLGFSLLSPAPFPHLTPFPALIPAAHAQTTYYVDGSCGSDSWSGTSQVCAFPNGPKRTIQAGIDTSATGDTVIVADGTYTGTGNRDLDFGGRDIHLRSESLNPALCIIDCQGTANDPHRGFYFHSGETTAAIVEGFTITNGYANFNDPGRGTAGGGVFCEDSSPTFRTCTIENNKAEQSGGGVWGHVPPTPGTPVLVECVVRGNQAIRGAGGGINCQLGVTLIDCEIIDLNCVSHPDKSMILESVHKTGRLLVADTSWQAYGVSAEICRMVAENAPSDLKAPVVTVGMQPAPCPTGKSLEDLFYPNLESLTDSIAKLVTGRNDHGIELPGEHSMADVYKRFKGPF